MNDIIDDLYKKNSEILEEFQSYLEKSIDDHPTLNASLEKSYVERKGNDFIYADTSTVNFLHIEIIIKIYINFINNIFEGSTSKN